MVGHSVITDLPRLKQREPGNSSNGIIILHHTNFVIGYDEDVSSTIWIKSKISNTIKVKGFPNFASPWLTFVHT